MLNKKQKLFVDEYVKTKNGLQSAMKVYNVKNGNSAKVIASKNLTNANIIQSVDKHLREAGYNPQQSINRLQANAEAGKGIKATASDSIRADELLLKLSNMLNEKKTTLNLNMDIDTMDKNKLFKVNEKYKKLIDNK